ncbi:conserved hypothetical protein [Candidatus Desulfarcum epimagneticum]|uniref:Radical SAM core domain-containing protein n=1 Tax=uncultured Desulfobacteraceae bacterium TaxID=218296 RepID=A0A484HIY1_9BACT|nr:conserved hypothetical protein [uncultured Desulfobacteraceae bacterium]
MKALVFKPLENHEAACGLCAHRCRIKDGRRGICGVRENRGGVLTPLVYGKIPARHVDPIEKKPLFHFHPGSRSYSIGAPGCNFTCDFCQNADLARAPKRFGAGPVFTPGNVAEAAIDAGCRSVSYTYSEPTLNFEFNLETARLASEKGLKNVFVTNGFMTREALDMIGPYLHGANVDLKSFSDAFYQKVCGARLSPVKETLGRMKESGIWVEVTTLVVPGLNDDPGELFSLASFIARELGEETPWHVSRFHPAHRMADVPPTPVRSVMAAREAGMGAGLKYVYAGNLPGTGMENSFCHQCQKVVMERVGFSISGYFIENGRCRGCGAEIHGVGL